MNDEVFAKLEKMFRTCHAMAKHKRPFKDFVWQCKLDKGKGLKIGTTYNNDKSARMFNQAIADTERAKVKTEIEDSKFSSLLGDGTTDSSMTENEIVYLRVWKQGTTSV